MDAPDAPRPPADDWLRVRALVRGRVQGVGFRHETVIEAQNLGLVGYVRNCSDRSVEVVAEGPGAVLNQLIAWLHRGPGMAIVMGVELTWQTPQLDMESFEVRW
jgi:acylphosphatase